MLYKDEGVPARVFHLADHFDSKDEEPDAQWRWVQADLPEVSRRLVVELTKKIAARKERLQFGFAFDGDVFSSDGEYLRQPTGMGLTCATVILKIFERLGIQVLKRDEWRSRDEDIAWQQMHVERLREKSLVLADKLAEHVGDPRFRPDEVAVGVASDHHPIGFEEAMTRAPKLAKELADSYKTRAARRGTPLGGTAT